MTQVTKEDEQMEPIKKVIIIDLSEYGAAGQIVMRKPSPRRQNEFKNQISRFYDNIQTKTLKPNAALGDMEMLMTLQYISEAPFPINLEGYFQFTDAMDPDYADALNTRIGEAAQELIKYSPFAGSPPQETNPSE